jgi:hypothetical protein
MRNDGNSLVLWLIFLTLPGSVAVLHGLFPLVVVLLIGIVLYIPFAMAFGAIRKAMWRHKHRAALSDWRYRSGGHHYDEQTQTWQVWDGSRYVPDKGQRPGPTIYGDEADAFDRHARRR